MDELTKGLIEHLKKSDPSLEVVETPRFLSVKDFHPISQENPMSTNDRDTHFLGAARCLAAEIANTDDWQLAAVETLIAHFAYDLVYHLLEKAPSGNFDVGFGTPGEIHETIAHLPDLDAWPT